MPSKKPPPKSAGPTLLSLIPDWMRELRAENRSPKTLRTYQQSLEAFCRWLSPDGKHQHCTTTIGMVDRQMLVDYFGWLYDNRSENTALVAHIGLSVFFDFCIEYDELEGDNPMRKIRRPHPMVKETPILTDEQIRLLLATCEKGKRWIDKRDYAIIRVSLASSLRLAELAAIDLGDVHLDDGVIEVQRGKGGRPRSVAIGPRVTRALSHYLHVRAHQEHSDEPALWLSYQGRYTADGIRAMVYRRAKQAGLSGIHPHVFRHWFAHGFLAAGGQVTDLLELAGWKDLRMIRERYGKSLAKERAIDAHHHLGIGEKW